MTNFCAARYATASAEAKLPGSSAGPFTAFTMLASPVSCSQFLQASLPTWCSLLPTAHFPAASAHIPHGKWSPFPPCYLSAFLCFPCKYYTTEHSKKPAFSMGFSHSSLLRLRSILSPDGGLSAVRFAAPP